MIHSVLRQTKGTVRFVWKPRSCEYPRGGKGRSRLNSSARRSCGVLRWRSDVDGGEAVGQPRGSWRHWSVRQSLGKTLACSKRRGAVWLPRNCLGKFVGAVAVSGEILRPGGVLGWGDRGE